MNKTKPKTPSNNVAAGGLAATSNDLFTERFSWVRAMKTEVIKQKSGIKNTPKLKNISE